MNQLKLKPHSKTNIDESLVLSLVESSVKIIQNYSKTKPILAKSRATQDLEVIYTIGGYVNFKINETPTQLIFAVDNEFSKLLFQKMTGAPTTEVNPAVMDCMKELTNIIYGTLKAPLSQLGYQFNMALPQTSTEINNLLKGKKSLEIPFRVDNKLSQFSLILSL